MDTAIRITIDQVPYSPNRYLRMHWSKRSKYNKQIERAVWIAKIKAGVHGRPQWSRVHIKITLRTWRSKMMDRDNAVGACKPVIDALVTLGVIADDSPEHVLSVTVDETKVCRAWAGAHIDIKPATGTLAGLNS